MSCALISALISQNTPLPTSSPLSGNLTRSTIRIHFQFHASSRIPKLINKFPILSSVKRALIPQAYPVAGEMDIPETTKTIIDDDGKKSVYSVWAVPPEDVRLRLNKLMEGLRSEFGGPLFEPHVTVVGSTSLAESDALEKFHSACSEVKAYKATVDRVATGTFFYQCVYLLLHPTGEVVSASSQCSERFQYNCPSPYMPHLSLLYGDLSDEEKRKAQEKAKILDEGIEGLSFPITRLALWETDTADKTLRSWKKVAECELRPN